MRLLRRRCEGLLSRYSSRPSLKCRAASGEFPGAGSQQTLSFLIHHRSIFHNLEISASTGPDPEGRRSADECGCGSHGWRVGVATEEWCFR